MKAIREDEQLQDTSPAQRFAARVYERARKDTGGGYSWKVWSAIAGQIGLVVVMLLTLFYGQIGGVIVWACTVS